VREQLPGQALESTAEGQRKTARHAITLISSCLLAGAVLLALSPPAHAAPARPAALTYGGSWAGNTALNWAEAHALGHRYCWGGSGPSCYDCSGLVMRSFAHAGIALPHSTYALPGSRHLHRVYDPRRGDLAFFGSGHVEFVTIWSHTTFGAHHSGTTVGWRSWSGYYHPTMYFRVS
jgi:cell wall-associated NlpC family hydrolase